MRRGGGGERYHGRMGESETGREGRLGIIVGTVADGSVGGSSRNVSRISTLILFYCALL